MQFPVPQFTDVEDKLIGSLTIKQFGILFAVGVVVFLSYSATKSILVMIFVFLLLGLPALGLALVPFNGRPMYTSVGKLFKFFTSPKLLIFHKEAGSSSQNQNRKPVSAPAQAQNPVSATDTKTNLRQVQELLKKTAREERDVAGKMH